jgi:aldehyde:ferredoxin oxidoreductase
MGVITQKDTDGIALDFGNAEALTVMAEKTGKYEGFGQILGLGSRLMCEKYGHPELSMAVKGQEFAGYDSRALQGMGLGYATSNRGACHLKHDVFAEDMEDQSGKGKAIPTKGDWNEERLLESGERTWNLERQYNLAAGLTRADDTLPKRLLEVPAPGGTAKGKVCELDIMLPEYYEARGWTKEGVPTKATLKRLGM